jgi:hypothetical protein
MDVNVSCKQVVVALTSLVLSRLTISETIKKVICISNNYPTIFFH